MKRAQYYTSLIFLLILVGLISSCNNENNSISIAEEAFLDKGDSLHSYTDTASFDAYTVRSDSIKALNYPQVVFGSYKESEFGASKAEIFTQIAPSVYNPDTIDAIQSLDSAVLYLKYSDIYGGSDDDPLKINVYALNQSFDSTFYAHTKPGGFYSPGDVLSDTTRKYIPANTGDVIRVPLLTEQVRDLLLDDNIRYASFSDFTEDFPGLFLSTDMQSTNESGSILTLQLLDPASKIVLYYNDSLRYEYPINKENCRRLNLYEHDYQGSFIEKHIGDTMSSHSHTYIQSMVGVETRLDFDLTEKLENLNTIVDAKLVLPVKTPNNADYSPIDTLTLRGITTKLPDDPYYIQDRGYIGGIYDEAKQTYTFTVTRYIQNLVCKNSGTNFCAEDYGDKIIVFPGLYRDFNLYYNCQTAARTILNTKDMRLEIKYLD